MSCEILKETVPDFDVDSDAVKAKIQGLRSTFREEVRKVKKSQGTGSGAMDIYVPKWKFYDSCKFLEIVLVLEQTQTVTNLEQSQDDDTHHEVDESDTSQTDGRETPKISKMNLKRKKETPGWLDSASEALKSLAQSA